MDERYKAIIDLPRHVSHKRRRMEQKDRAAQFAPYAALTGYGDVVDEVARLTEEQIIPDECVIEMLNHKLVYIMANAGRVEATFTYFLKDARKSGGHYLKKSGYAIKFDEIERRLIFSDGSALSIESIVDIEY